MSTETPTIDQNPDIDAVIRKIQKILTRTKTGRGTTDEESDTAMKIVQELMAKYNLDMATVDAAGAGPEDHGSVRVDETSTSRTRFKWQRELAQAVAEANFCLHMIRTEYVKDENGHHIEITRKTDTYYGETSYYKRRPVHRFIGRKANVITTQLMFTYLCDAIDERTPPQEGRGLTKQVASFKEGCAAKLCERLAQRRQDLMDEHDARVRAEAAVFKADAARRAKENKEKAERTLGPRPKTDEEMVAELKKGAWEATGFKSEPPEEDPDRPEIEKDAWVPGAGAEPEPEIELPGTALVLSSVYDDREKELNNDVLRGWPPGTTTQKRLDREEWLRKWKDEEAAREADEAAQEREADEKPLTPETDRQRERRLKREEKEWEETRARWARQDERDRRREAKERARIDHGAYMAGNREGTKIGLDPQVREKKDAKRLSS